MLKINKIIRYDGVGLPPNEFDGNTTQFLRNENQPHQNGCYLTRQGWEWVGL